MVRTYNNNQNILTKKKIFMKKLFLGLLLLSCSICSVEAQNVLSPSEPYPVYCTIMGYNFWGVGKVKVKLDLGTAAYGKDFESLYDKETGKKIKFNTMMAVINYMSKRGWTLDQVTSYQENNLSKSNVIHYIMKKMVKNDEEIREGLITRESDD